MMLRALTLLSFAALAACNSPPPTAADGVRERITAQPNPISGDLVGTYPNPSVGSLSGDGGAGPLPILFPSSIWEPAGLAGGTVSTTTGSITTTDGGLNTVLTLDAGGAGVAYRVDYYWVSNADGGDVESNSGVGLFLNRAGSVVAAGSSAGTALGDAGLGAGVTLAASGTGIVVREQGGAGTVSTGVVLQTTTR
jgi:hypothetical protein